LASVAGVAVLEVSGKQRLIPAGVLGLLCGVAFVLAAAFPARWTWQRILTLSLAALVLVLSLFELLGVLRLGAHGGLALVALSLVALAAKKSKAR
jgi:hypothetical protein